MSKITSRDFARPAHKQFYDALMAISPSGAIGFYKLFEDFLTLAAAAIYQGAHSIMAGHKSPEVEAAYMETVGRYDKEKAKNFSVAMAILTNGLETELHDFLGDVYSCTGISNHWNGQFFTPWPICQMMTKMTLEAARPRDVDHRFTVQEPAVGGGAMLLAVATELKALELRPWHWWFDATDIDLRCFHMAYIQLALAGAPGVVRHGDSLRLTQWRAWVTPLGAMFPHRYENLREVPTPVVLPPPNKPFKPYQPSLFDHDKAA